MGYFPPVNDHCLVSLLDAPVGDKTSGDTSSNNKDFCYRIFP